MLPFGAMQGQGTLEVRGRNDMGPLRVQPVTGPRRLVVKLGSSLLALLEHGVVPIVNENDVVADDELRFGDNDRLSAVVAALVDADLLLLLSDVAGLHDVDPRRDPAARLIPDVAHVDAAVERLAHPSSSGLGTGGMVTKLQAA